MVLLAAMRDCYMQDEGHPQRPSGTVTFLFTDVEGSTRLWAADADAMSASLLVHDEVLRSAIESRGGYVFTTAGDSFAAAFGRASEAVAAAEAAQLGLAGAAWPGPALKVRMGLHLGEAEERGGDYFGPVVNTTARVEAAGHGGQTLLTDAVRSAARVEGATDLGLQTLRDVTEQLHLFQLGDGVFAALRVVANSPATNLPVRPTRLIGRQTELVEVCRLLAANRLVTVAAVGGSGKTRLAVAVGFEELSRRPDGVWFVDLTAVSNDEDVPGAAAVALGLQLTGGDPAAQLVAHLVDKQALLILDNCEHVIDAAAGLCEALLAGGGKTVVLATSREALDIDGERVVQLGSLSGPVDDSSTASPAVELFVERATAADPTFDPDPDGLSTISEVCVRLDGMPLAIELAAARVTVMTPAQLLEGLDDRFRLLSGGRRRQRQRTLEATLDWSYDLLEPADQRVFRSLGVFVGGFDAAAAAAVAQLDHHDALDTIEALVAKSLVNRLPIEGVARFGLYETVKAYAEDRLIQAGEAGDDRDCHAAHFHQLVTARGRAMSADIRLGHQLRHDKSNMAMAFDWAAGKDDWVLAGELLLGSLAVFHGNGFTGEALDLFLRCRGPVDERDPLLGDFLRASVTVPAIVLDEFGLAFKLANELTGSTDPRCRAFAHGFLIFLTQRHSPASADQHWEQAALALAECGDPDDLNTQIARAASGCHAFGFIYDGKYVEALALLHDTASTDAGHAIAEDIVLAFHASMCHLFLGDPARALETIPSLEGLAYAFGSFDEFKALIYLALGDAEAATAYARQFGREAATGRISRDCNDALIVLAAISEAAGDGDRARELLLHSGIGRSPATIAYAGQLAIRLGIDEQHREREAVASRFLSPTELELNWPSPMATLREEMVRRGWNA
jgi:predicted ATPase/class 3 adenylate cyclase